MAFMRSVMRAVSSQGPLHQGHPRLKIFVPQKQKQLMGCFSIFLMPTSALSLSLLELKVYNFKLPLVVPFGLNMGSQISLN